jgi:hypothetical protein
MRYFILGFLTGALVLGFWSASATAQDATPSADEPATIEYRAAPAVKPGYDEYRRDELERKVKRSRNALIGTSAAAVVGLPLWIAGAQTQCVQYDDGSGNTQTQCTTGGKVMLGIGYPLAIGGITGALVSGIILGVRKGKLRDAEARMRYSSSKRLRWDPFGSQFVF